MLRLTSLLALAAFTATATAQFSLVIPNGMATAEGNSSNAFPWGRGGTGLRIQTLYDSSNFTAQGVTFPIIITGLKWRPNTAVALSASSYTSGCTVSMSTSPTDAATPSTAFASNQGPDLTTCYSGVVSWAAQPAQTGPTPFGISVPFTTNFVYDPNLGDLNIECDMPIQTFTGAGPQLDVNTSAGTSRVYLSTGYVNGGPNATGTVNASHGVVVEVDYVPASGLYAGFSASTTAGGSPLTVNFTDHSFSSDPNGVLSWAWDFDGDSVIDSTLQNPTWVYNSCGNFNVSLTVTDASHTPSTLSRPGFIKTDEITTNFTFSLLAAPNIFQFTDTTTPTPTAWAWDFDNDGITDSTAQNPIWLLPNCQSATVKLTATRNCRTGVKTQTTFLSPFNLPTIYTGGNGGSSGWIVFFDVNVTNPQGINICGLATNSSTAANTPFSMTVYVTPNTYVGSDNNIAPWRVAGIASGTTAGTNLPSIAALATPIYLAPGSYGIGLYYNGATNTYTNGNGANQVYGNSDLTITAGAARSTLFAGGSYFTPRVWNGTIFYDTMGGAATAGYGFFGAGCAGSLGISKLVNTNRPQLGTTLTVNVDNLPQSMAVMMVGFSNTTSLFGPLPLDVTPFGAPGCFGRVSSDATAFLIGSGNAASWSFGVPNDAGLVGLRLFNQALVLDPAANALGAVLSDAAALLIGN